MTKEEFKMLKRAIDSHTHLLLQDVEAYKETSNVEAIKDCLNEVRKYNTLKQKINNL